ncbi:MAG: efflux RND transporter permease subunit [Lentisphaeria bacterium]|nr:efflux RND transporter permease subunit [Lentisphaeria bacterium]
MSISELSVKRKVAMCAFLFMLIFLGIKMYRSISIDALPKFDVPYVVITTIYPGASPEEMEVDVVKRIEDAVSSIDGLKHTTCVCMENAAVTTLEFVLGTDVDIMIHEVREKINTIIEDFPSGVETPTLSKVNINAIPVVTMFLTGTHSIDELYDYADETLSNQFSSIPGVGEVRIHGGNEMQLHIILDREKLADSGLTIEKIISRISASNIKLPAGHIRENGREMSVTYDAEYRDIQSMKDIEISSNVGKRIYLGDIAEIKLMSKEIRQLAYLDGKPAVQLEIVKRSDANAVKVINAARKRFEQITNGGELPGGMTLKWFKDSGEFIQSSVDDAWSSILLGIILTATLLFLFLHDIKSTFIAAISMPVSIVISFIAMKGLDYTFDMMTLVSLGCSAGVLVTNAVVVLENIFKRMHEGKNAKEASIQGAQEVIIAVAASALTNVVVFVPVAMMSSIVGLLISPFAGVMVVATLASLFVSFTLTPILASLLYAKGERKPGKIMQVIFAVWDTGYNAIEKLFIKSIELTRRCSWLVILLCVGVSAALLLLALPHVSMSFFPSFDKGELSVTLEYPANTALSVARDRTLEIIKELQKKPEVTSIGATIGYVNSVPGKVSEGVYLADISLNLLPKNKRQSLDDFALELRKEFAQKHNLLYAVNIPNPLGSAGAEINFDILGPDFTILQQEATRATKLLQESGIASDIDTSLRASKPRVNIRPDRTILRNLSLSESALGTTALGFFDGVEAGTFKIGTRTYDIRVKTNEMEHFGDMENITIANINGHPVAISAFAQLESSPVSISMFRQDKQRGARIYCNSTNGGTMGDIINLLKTKFEGKLPQGYTLHYAGTMEMMGDATQDFKDTFIIAIVLTYLLIAALMESWTRPFLILFTIPLGFVGMFTIMWLTGTPLSMVGMLGAVMMIGIVVNNAILIMDETAALSAKGLSAHDAMLLATKSKFRPIAMTSIASVCGMLPMAFGTGLGSELRSSCGIGVVGGLIYSAVMTLYLIPALYFAFVKNTNTQQE